MYMYNYIICYIYYTHTSTAPLKFHHWSPLTRPFGFNPHATTAAWAIQVVCSQETKGTEAWIAQGCNQQANTWENTGVIKLPIWGDQMYANVWWFWGISPIMVHCLGWFHIMTPEIHGDVLFKLIPIGPIWRLQSEVISGQDLETLNIEMLIMTKGDLDTGNALECGQT